MAANGQKERPKTVKSTDSVKAELLRACMRQVMYGKMYFLDLPQL